MGILEVSGLLHLLALVFFPENLRIPGPVLLTCFFLVSYVCLLGAIAQLGINELQNIFLQASACALSFIF